VKKEDNRMIISDASIFNVISVNLNFSDDLLLSVNINYFGHFPSSCVLSNSISETGSVSEMLCFNKILDDGQYPK
jgi:hypothetical protein